MSTDCVSSLVPSDHSSSYSGDSSAVSVTFKPEIVSDYFFNDLAIDEGQLRAGRGSFAADGLPFSPLSSGGSAAKQQYISVDVSVPSHAGVVVECGAAQCESCPPIGVQVPPTPKITATTPEYKDVVGNKVLSWPTQAPHIDADANTSSPQTIAACPAPDSACTSPQCLASLPVHNGQPFPSPVQMPNVMQPPAAGRQVTTPTYSPIAASPIAQPNDPSAEYVGYV